MSVIRTVFLGTPKFAEYHLQVLLDDEHYEVVGVVTQPDRPAGRKMKLTPSPVKVLAKAHDIPVLTPEKVKEPDVLKEIAAWKAEVAVVVAFGQILPKSFLDLFPKMVVNVHGSLLPRWRGAAPIQRALMEGDETSGVSLQVMVEELDAGPVIGERRLSLRDHDALTLHDEMMKLGGELLHLDLMDYIRGNLAATPQDAGLVTHAPKIQKSEGKINWSQPAQVILNRLRGLKMGPGSYTLRDGKKLKIHQAEVVAAQVSAEPGTVVGVDDLSMTVVCGTAALRLLEVQPESKPKMSAAAYMAGHPVSESEVWGE